MPEEKEVIINSQNIGLFYYKDKKKEDFRSWVLNKIRLKDLKKAKKWVLNDISFKGYSGEILGIVGSNGTGKTTLCRILSGLLKPDKGSLTVNGSVSALLSLGVGFNAKLTGRENIYLNGTMMGLSLKQVNEYFDKIYEFSELKEFIDVPIKNYSTGMKIRLGFSIAAMIAPEILVLDETFSTGDLAFRKKSAKKLEELISKARMIVIVTHDMNFVKTKCTRAIWIDQGYVKADGDPTVVADTYLNYALTKKTIKKQFIIDYKKTNAEIGDKNVIIAEHLGIYFKKKRQKFWALKDVSFSIKRGEIVGIIGSNGAGKSTLCRTLVGIYKPDEGSLFVNGKTSSLLSLGSGFNHLLPAEENIYLNGMMIGIPKERLRELKDDIIDFAELREDVNKPLKSYSSGMRSKLGFSIAAAVQPELFIIDEALSAGDASFQKKASETIQKMIKNAEAVMIVTHSLDFVEKVCTRALLFDHGRLLFDGAPKEAVEKYKK
ncbi:MAG: ABC transporter ATP-binding protein [Spirochaetia bacterium]|nr:ABC transporter ATP-binding protein [Spirochaetia bacterium]